MTGNKPVATREAVQQWIRDNNWTFERLGQWHGASDFIIAALNHFATPRQRTMIEGMSRQEIEAEMYLSMEEKRKRMEGVIYVQECARVAHRLATTPAREGDGRMTDEEIIAGVIKKMDDASRLSDDERSIVTEALEIVLDHFVPPISRMSVEEIEVAMVDNYRRELRSDEISMIAHCASVAHRLATTPAPEVDPDEGAKAEAWAYITASDEANLYLHKTKDDLWNDLPEPRREYMRGVAKLRAVAALEEAERG